MSNAPTIIALRRVLPFGPLSINVSELVYYRAQCMSRDLGLQYQADTSAEPVILMAFMPRADGESAMHAHSTRADDPKALGKAAEELINRVWRAYVRAVEEATA